jgi:hypothetical protein
MSSVLTLVPTAIVHSVGMPQRQTQTHWEGDDDMKAGVGAGKKAEVPLRARQTCRLTRLYASFGASNSSRIDVSRFLVVD